MEFVKRGACPALLAINKNEWTEGWVKHYRWGGDSNCRPPKPKDGHWRRDEIRRPLIDAFHNNCGYCGDSIPTPLNGNAGKNTSKGDVDHYLEKATYPEFVYDWNNFIWSCKPCNQLKNDRKYGQVINPCDQLECNFVGLCEDSGKYFFIVPKFYSKNVDKMEAKFNSSELRTTVNSEEIASKRKNRLLGIRKGFESINGNIVALEMLGNEQAIKKILEKQIIDDMDVLRALLDSPDFYFLTHKQFFLLIREYPKVAILYGK